MGLRDSIDKVITRYFSTVTNEEFEYKGKVYRPKALRLHPSLLRGYTCPEGCGACCPRFSIDFLPSEPHPHPLLPRGVLFSGREVLVYSDLQVDHDNYHCRYLKGTRCSIHSTHSFTCDFELIRPLVFLSPQTPNMLTQRLYGRAWAMKRSDGLRGTLCEILPPSGESIQEVSRKIRRLESWCQHFGLLDTKCPGILEWIESVRERALQGTPIATKVL